MIADLKPYPAMKDSGVEWLPGRNGIAFGMLFSGRVIESSVAQDLAYASPSLVWSAVRFNGDAPRTRVSRNPPYRT